MDDMDSMVQEEIVGRQAPLTQRVHVSTTEENPSSTVHLLDMELSETDALYE